MATDRITAIKKHIVAKLEAGEDVSELSRQLAQERAKIATEAEVQELQQIATERQKLKVKAEAVKVKAQTQGDAIDAFLKARDGLLPKLQELQEPLKELAQMANTSWEDHPGECYLFNDAGAFSASVIDLPRELLPKDFSCPSLEMMQPSELSYGKARQAFQYFQYCIGILSSFKKGSMSVRARPTDDSLLLDTETTEVNCLVCQHDRLNEINKALQAGRPLRELETEYNVSRSTLSRHKNRCLNLEAISIAE